MAGGQAPPVSLSGDIVYVGTSPQAARRELADREPWTRPTQSSPASPTYAAAARPTYGEDEATIVDVATGKVLLRAPVDGYGYFNLSPDGR